MSRLDASLQLSPIQLLPPELLELIFQATGDHKPTLNVLCRTCPQFLDMARRRLYRSTTLYELDVALDGGGSAVIEQRKRLFDENLERLHLKHWRHDADTVVTASVIPHVRTFLETASLPRLGLLRIEFLTELALASLEWLVVNRHDGIAKQIRELVVYCSTDYIDRAIPLGKLLDQLTDLDYSRVWFHASDEANGPDDGDLDRALVTPDKVVALIPRHSKRVAFTTIQAFDYEVYEAIRQHTAGRLHQFYDTGASHDERHIVNILTSSLTQPVSSRAVATTGIAKLRINSSILQNAAVRTAIGNVSGQLHTLSIITWDDVGAYLTDDITEMFVNRTWPNLQLLELTGIQPQDLGGGMGAFLKQLVPVMPSLFFLSWMPYGSLTGRYLPFYEADDQLTHYVNMAREAAEAISAFKNLTVVDMTFSEKTPEHINLLISMLATHWSNSKRAKSSRVAKIVVCSWMDEKIAATVKSNAYAMLPQRFSSNNSFVITKVPSF
ncbi:hypothetical protein GQ42DRAFT_162026 [Ramicandelaber brevisporus]|nr:hypothetical protein GQ42DRAFT_162026 [Ramicandelaber brevisporus]